jgi:hypothetical protein
MDTVRRRWTFRTSLARRLGCDGVCIFRFEVVQAEAPVSVPDLEQLAGEFIARQVLDKDSGFFEG